MKKIINAILNLFCIKVVHTEPVVKHCDNCTYKTFPWLKPCHTCLRNTGKAPSNWKWNGRL